MRLVKSELTFHEATRTAFTRNKSRRFIAVEIEVSKADSDTRINRAVEAWSGSIVEDGSLPDCGFEINTAPANGDLFIQQIEEIGRALKAQGAEVTTSCGLHVHVDARDYTYYDIRRLILLYAAIESSLFRMVPKSRSDNNHYCLPCADVYLQALEKGRLPKESKKGIIRALYKGDSTQGHRSQKYDRARYYALNLHSWLYRGTVECRLFNGTVDSRKIVNWGLLWASILDTAMGMTEAQIEAWRAEKTSREILLSVCPTEAVQEWVKERWAKFGG